MRTISLGAAAVSLLAVATPAPADTVDAYCSLSWHDHSKAMVEGPCVFSQRQGNVTVSLRFYRFSFLAAEQGKTYERQHTAEKIRLNREGHYTLQVFQGGQPVGPRPNAFGGKPPIHNNARWPLACTLNGLVSTCRTEPAKQGGFTVLFSHGDQPSFTFTPVGAPTTDRREMIDGTGQRWAMRGHHSLELEEINGSGNKISVSNP